MYISIACREDSVASKESQAFKPNTERKYFNAVRRRDFLGPRILYNCLILKATFKFFTTKFTWLTRLTSSLVPRCSDCFFLRKILLRVRRGMSREAGRGTGSVERLAENAKNMADTTHTSIELCAGMEQLQPLLERINEDERLLLADIHRPIHEAYMLQKILCPIESCVKDLHFFDENGIGHHFRMIHKCDFTKENHQESLRICQKLLED